MEIGQIRQLCRDITASTAFTANPH